MGLGRDEASDLSVVINGTAADPRKYLELVFSTMSTTSMGSDDLQFQGLAPEAVEAEAEPATMATCCIWVSYPTLGTGWTVCDTHRVNQWRVCGAAYKMWLHIHLIAVSPNGTGVKPSLVLLSSARLSWPACRMSPTMRRFHTEPTPNWRSLKKILAAEHSTRQKDTPS